MAEKIYADIQTLEPKSEIHLYELDVSHLGGDIAYFHAHRQSAPIYWQGKEYHAFPVEATGFAVSGTEAQPTPELMVGDPEGGISTLCALYKDLARARFTRKRTLLRFLDAENFPDGNPDADPNEAFPDDVFYISQKIEQVPGKYVRFQLKSALDLDGSYIPSRPVIKNVCGWAMIGGYRGPYCGYTGTAYFDKDDNPVPLRDQDECSYRLKGCQVRFGTYNELPFGGFPGTTLTKG